MKNGTEREPNENHIKSNPECFFFPFRDICPVLYDCNALRTVTDILTEHIKANFAGVDAIVGSCKIFLC